MKEFTRANGTVRLRLPDTAGDVVDAPAGITTERPRGGGSPRGESIDTGTSIELDIMLDALAEEESVIDNAVQELDRFAVDLGDGNAPARSRSRGDDAADQTQALDLDVTLAADESAVVLIEQNGSFEWHYPNKRKPAARARGDSSAGTPNDESIVEFHIPIGISTSPPTGSRSMAPRGGTHRGLITNFIKGRIIGVVLKFVARKSVGALTRRLERGVESGPVLITSASDANAWTQQATLVAPAHATDEPMKVLLLVHGTFSSTLGSYGALTTTDEGQALLSKALQNYDLVLGYDHHTLSDTPEQNAEALLHSLAPLLDNNGSVQLDAIAFSRGGLVFRFLSEVLIPDTAVKIDCRKAIFVGCTNAGTELANDENWKHLVDFYTNMVAGATRLIGLAPGAALPTRILRQGIKLIGSLVTYMAQDGVADNSVPGVAAMEPGGSFVTALNILPEHRERPAVQASYTLASNFEPGDNDEQIRLGKQLVLKVSDGVVDRLMGKANDLVVNTDSMAIIDPHPGARLLESHSLDANDTVYHTVYFHQPFVAKLCSRWLELDEQQPATQAPDAGRNHA